LPILTAFGIKSFLQITTKNLNNASPYQTYIIFVAELLKEQNL